jgi:hypothetical protein
MILIRYLLVGLIIYLIIRAFIRFSDDNKTSGGQYKQNIRKGPSSKKVSKAIGEYIDYEEVKDKKKEES